MDAEQVVAVAGAAFLESLRRVRYFAFVMRREYLGLSDPFLVTQLEQHRRSGVRFLSFLLAGFTLFGLALIWLRVGEPTG